MKKNISFDQISSSKSTSSTSNGSNNVDGPGSIGAEGKVEPPEVFLGGSCNPTTWRADVAIPALTQLGISFYNPVGIFSGSLMFLKTHKKFLEIPASISMDSRPHRIGASS